MNSNILEQYAIRKGFSPKELSDDYESASEAEQLKLMSYIMQSGGEVGSTQEADMQIVQLFSQKTGTPVEQIIQQLQQMSPEQISAAMQQMIGVIEGDEQESVDNAQEEQTEIAQGGFDAESLLGYSDKSPYKYNTSNLIKSNNITMNDTGIDLMGVSDTGDTQYMPAYSGDYEFSGNEVTEFPVYQTGSKNVFVKKKIGNNYLLEDGTTISIKEFNKNYTPSSNNRRGYMLKTNLPKEQKDNTFSDFFTKDKNEYKPAFRNNLKNKNNNIVVKGENKNYQLTPFTKNTWIDDSGNKWKKNTGGGFIMEGNDIQQPTITAQSIAVNPAKPNVRYTGPKSVNPSTDGLDNYFENQDTINKPTDGRIDFGDINTIASKPRQEVPTRFSTVPSTLERKTPIQYSPKIEGITPEKAQAKSKYKFNTSSPLGDLINNFKVAKSFEAIDLPYMQEVDARMPEGIKLDPRPGLQSISEQFSKYRQGINPNSATGQAVLASLAGKEEAASTQYLNGLQQQQATMDYQTQVNRAELYNKIQQQKNTIAANYTDGVLRADANRDAIIDSTLSNVQQLQNNRQLEENAYNQMLAFNANLEDESGFFDKLLGRRKFSFDKEKAYQQNFAS